MIETTRPFAFESVESAVQRADRQRSSGSRFNLGPNRHPVGVLAKPKDSQQNYLLKLTEMLAAGHMICIVELYDPGRKEVSAVFSRGLAGRMPVSGYSSKTLNPTQPVGNLVPTGER